MLLHGSAHGSANAILSLSAANSISSTTKTTMASRGGVPRISNGVRVVTKKKPARYGKVVDAAGRNIWSIHFDDGATEQLSSAQLAVDKAYYNKPKTPAQAALDTIKKRVASTIS
jgi:hypothetical protein